MKTTFPLLVTLAIFCFALPGALSQVAGGAQDGAYLIGATPSMGPQRWLSIPQTSEREWERLGSTFTLETWVWMEPPASSPDGNWTDASGEDELQFLSLISRHPGGNLQNEWAHFQLQVTRSRKGPVVVFWSGCGCEGPATSEPEDPSTCGFGYMLASDSEKISPQLRFSLVPGEWHHIAVSVDGDSTNAGFTSERARLYIDGQFLLQNEYGSDENTPSYRESNPCPGRPLFSHTLEGTKNEMVTLGWYDNGDVREEGNMNSVYGFDGYMDEVRIWGIARSESQIKTYWTSAVSPSAEELVAYYNFNSRSEDETYPNVASMEGMPAAMVRGPQDQPGMGSGSTGLIISQMVRVYGTDFMTDEVNYADFSLLGDSETGYFITVASDLLAEALLNGDAELMDSMGNAVLPDMLPYEVDLGMLSVAWFCNNETGCDNIPEYQDLWLAFSSIEEPMEVSQVFFQVLPACAEGYDACGECGGDNRTCQCVIYHDFRNTRMAYILLTWTLEKLIVQIDDTVKILRDINSIVTDVSFDDEFLEGNYTLAHEVSYMMDFYNLCLTDYCADVTEFIAMLDRYLLTLLPESYAMSY